MEEQMAALSAGAEMYITKPFNAEYLRISVGQVMERKEVLKNYFSSPISSFEKSDGKLTHKESKKFLQSVLNCVPFIRVTYLRCTGINHLPAEQANNQNERHTHLT